MGAVTPGSKTIYKVFVNTRVIYSLSRIKIKITFDTPDERKPTANDGADCVSVMLPRHATVYHDAKHFDIVCFLN